MKKQFTLVLLLASFIAFAQVDKHLIGYWPLDGSAIDVSGNELHGTATTITPVADRDNRTDCACGAFTEPIALPKSKFLDIGPMDSMSVSLWYKGGSKDTSDLEIIFGKYAGQGSTKNYYLGLFSQNRPVEGRPYPNFTEDFYEGDTINWHHQVMTYKNKEWRMFYDGKEYGKYWIDTAIVLDSTVRLMIGNTFKGAIDDVRFYRDDLDQSTVDQLFKLPSSCTITALKGEDSLSETEQNEIIKAYNNLGQEIDHTKYTGLAIVQYANGKRSKILK